MNYYAFLPLTVFYLNSLLFFSLYPRKDEHQAINAYLVGTLCAMFWGLMDFLLWLPFNPALNPLLIKLAPYGWFGIGYSGVRFIYAYLGLERDVYFKILTGVIGVVYLAYSFLVWTPFAPFHIPMNSYGFYGWWVNTLSFFVFTLPAVLTIWLMFRTWRGGISFPQRRTLGYFVFGGILSVIIILIRQNVVADWGIPAPVISILLVLLSTLIIMWVIQRYDFFGWNLSLVGKELFAVMPEGVLLLNKKNEVININPAAESFLKIKKEHLPIALDEVMPEFEQVRHADQLIIQRDGDVHFLSQSTTILQDSWNGTIQLLMLHNITDVRRAEQRAMELEMQQKVDTAKESERQRVARDLHDGISQTLYSIKLITEVLPLLLKKNLDSAERRIGELHTLAQNASNEMRSLLLELRPERVLQIPVPDLLNLLTQVGSIEQGGNIVMLADANFPVLPPRIHLAYYRIAQEAINNAIRHAPQSTITVFCRKADGQAVLQIQDDGDGFVPEEVKGNHFGLHNMRERAKEINAALEIVSSPGNGTIVRLSWDLAFAEEENEREQPDTRFDS